MEEEQVLDEYVCIKALEDGVTIIGLTRGRDTKFHHTEKLDAGEVMLAQFTQNTSAIKIRGKSFYTNKAWRNYIGKIAASCWAWEAREGMDKVKRVAVLTSGGDAPGMNAAVRAVVRTGIGKGLEIYGVECGYNGLINDRMSRMTERSVADIIHRGGTILRTARCEAFKTRPGQEKGFAVLRKNGIDGVIAIGGDGSFMGARVLSLNGFHTIGLPGTIDNDLAYTDFTIGFDTAVNTVINAINNIRDTMTSHDRISIVEVMGRNCGDIAVYAGIAGGAEVVLVPEVPWTLDQVCDTIARGRVRGKEASIIILAEGTGHANDLERAISQRMQLDVRSVVLGHIQRGGNPTVNDRILASRVGARAVDLLTQRTGNRVVGIRHNQIIDMDIMEALAVQRQFDMELYGLVTELSR